MNPKSYREQHKFANLNNKKTIQNLPKQPTIEDRFEALEKYTLDRDKFVNSKLGDLGDCLSSVIGSFETFPGSYVPKDLATGYFKKILLLLTEMQNKGINLTQEYIQESCNNKSSNQEEKLTPDLIV